MAFIGPKVADYSEKAHNAGAMGFNLLRDFQREMWTAYPETTQYNFGYFSDSDINQVSVMGWQHLKASMWDMEDWNRTVGLRFGLRTDGGDNVMYGENYIMLMPRKHRDEVILPARKAAHDRQEQTAKDAAAYVHPEDPEKNKMLDHAQKISEETSSTKTVTASGTSGPGLGADPEGDIW